MVLACVPVGAWTDRTIRMSPMKPTPKPARVWTVMPGDEPACCHYPSCRLLAAWWGEDEWKPGRCLNCTHKQVKR